MRLISKVNIALVDNYRDNGVIIIKIIFTLSFYNSLQPFIFIDVCRVLFSH